MDPSGIAGPSTIGAGVSALIAGILLAVFFATSNVAWGRANDAASVAFSLLLVPAALAMHQRYAPVAPWMLAVTALGLIALGVAAGSSLLTALGRLSVEDLTRWQGGSFAAVFAWVGAVSAAIVGLGGLPAGIGWLGLVAAALAVGATLEVVRLVRRHGMAELARMTRVPRIAAGASLSAAAVFPIWCVWLGVALSGPCASALCRAVPP